MTRLSMSRSLDFRGKSEFSSVFDGNEAAPTLMDLPVNPGFSLSTSPGSEEPASQERLSSTGERIFSFNAVFEEHANGVWRILRTLGVLDASIDDAFQDVFLIVHQKLASFEGRSQLSTWIYGVAYRVAQNHRRRGLKHSYDEIPESAACLSPDPAARLAQGEEARFLEHFCLQLKESQRDVFVLCVLEDHTAPEAAELLGVKLNTVYSRIRNTRVQFREALEQFKLQSEGVSP